MPFFRYLHIFNNYISKNQRNKPSLRGLIPDILINKLSLYLYRYSQKRASSFISNSFEKASVTIETALVLPIFLFGMLSLISAFEVMKIKSCMDVAVVEAGNAYALERYGDYMGDLYMPMYIRQNVNTFLSESLSYKEQERIEDNVYVTDFSFEEEDNVVSFRVDYEIRTNFGLPGLDLVKLHSGYYGYVWNGYEKKNEAEKMVYISDNASVYHLDKNCTHLNVSVQSVAYSNLKYYRNADGKKYDDCSFCNQLDNSSIVYITPEGTNYHNTDSCIGLTRHIHTVLLSSVTHKKICTRCGK